MLLFSLLYFFDNFSLKLMAWVPCGILLQKESKIPPPRGGGRVSLVGEGFTCWPGFKLPNLKPCTGVSF